MGSVGPEPPADVAELTRALLERPDDTAAWARLRGLPDEEKSRFVVALKERIDRLGRSEPNGAMSVAELLLRALPEIPREAALIHRARGVAFYFGGRMADARAEFLAAMHAYERAGEPVEAARIRRNLVEVNLTLGRLEDALECGREARRVFAATAREDLLAELDINVGNIYFRMDEYARAREHYSAA